MQLAVFLRVGIAACIALGLASCGSSDGSSAAQPAMPTVAPAGATPQTALATATATDEEAQMQLKPTQSGAQATPLASNTTTPAQSTAAPDVTLSQTETEELVKTQLAALLKSPVEQIQLVSTVARTWPDQGLGCGRKGLYEPLPTPGYELTLAHAGQTFRYHTDQQGRLIRCIEPGKPRGPISR